MKKKSMVPVMVFLCLSMLWIPQFPAKAEVIHENELEEYIMSELSAAHVLGMNISIVNSEKELYCAAYGSTGETERDFIIGDLSKSFTAAAIMRLVEDSELRLEDPVGDYLPQYTKIADVTINQLLNHTSGITKYEKMSDITADGARGSFEYANANYNLLGEIIEAVTEMSYEEYISDNILDALDMVSTYSLRNSTDMKSELVTGHRNYLGFPFVYDNKYNLNEDWMQVPSGYVISDVKDMGNYLQMFLQNGGDVFADSSIEALLHQGVEIPEKDPLAREFLSEKAMYNMGWISTTVYDTEIFYHTGTVENYTSAMFLIPSKDLGITIMFDTTDALLSEKLMKKLEAGILAIELDQTPEKLDNNDFYMSHGFVDVVMVILILLAWIPIFMLGTWSKNRRNKLLSTSDIVIDIVIHLGIPTALILIIPNLVSVFWIKRYIPELYWSGWIVIATLYLGAIFKGIMMIIFSVLGPKSQNEVDEKETDAETDSLAEDELDQNVAASKNEEKAEDGTAQSDISKEEKTEDDTVPADNQKEETVENPEKVSDGREKKKEEVSGNKKRSSSAKGKSKKK